MFRRARPVSYVNARVTTPHGTASSIRFAERVLALDEPPADADYVVDLDGAFVLPGLINAHDHLELNHYGRLKRREQYRNASEWSDDLRPALREDPWIKERSAQPLADRLFIGGLKNLLSGATTVAHHNPMYRALKGRFPVRVVNAFGWAHSFALEGRPVGAGGELGASVAQARADTPGDLPFIVHAAEGIDEQAADEIAQLDAIGCLRRGTVLVHGLAISIDGLRGLLSAGVGLIWCPASNVFLFGQTIPARSWLDASPEASSHLCLATDSRVTGSRDLLTEIRVALDSGSVTAGEVLKMVTMVPARLLRLPEAGVIAEGRLADLIVLPPTQATAAETLANSARADLWCVTIGGQPIIATRRFCGAFAARAEEPRPLMIDGTEHVASAALVRDLIRCAIQEPGVTSVA